MREPSLPAHISAALLDVLGTGVDEEFDDLAELAAALCGTPVSQINLLGAERQYSKGIVGMEPSPVNRASTFCQYVIQQDGVFVVSDAASDIRFYDNPLVTGVSAVLFYAGVPLYAPDGTRIGALCVMDTVPRELKPTQARALVLLSRQINARIELRALRHRAETPASASSPSPWAKH